MAKSRVTGIAATMTILEKYRDNVAVMISAIITQIVPSTMKSIVPWECFISFSLRENTSIMLLKYRTPIIDCFGLFEVSMASS
jgi:hypothetical protein